MTSRLLNGILTEFDDRISSELNLDPLGLQVIWSAYGQAIFRNRISSISNDVRNFTLNLFHHRVTKALVEDASVELGRGLSQQRGYVGAGKDSMAFKQACLIHLENLFAFSMVEAQDRVTVDPVGVLGISKSRRQWEGANGDPTLRFGHEPSAHVLVRQNSLGVSGRYKTPLVQMKFFDGRYDYARPDFQSNWGLAEEQLFDYSRPLGKLLGLATKYLAEVVKEHQREPQRKFSAVPTALKKAVVNSFSTPPLVGSYARPFWLAVTELDKGASGALFKVLDDEARKKGDGQWLPRTIFAKASQAPLADADKAQLDVIQELEPLLGELSLMLDVMLSSKSHSLEDVREKWKLLGRDAATLPTLARRIAFPDSLAPTAASRLKELLRIAAATDVRRQMEGILQYHEKVMDTRGQAPWLRLQNGNQLRIDARTRKIDEKGRGIGTWVHQYYIPQFRLLLSGLRGTA